MLTDEDFADLPLTTSRTIDVLEFVQQDEVDPIYFEKTYYLEPEKTGVRPYVLLRDALEDSGRVAVVKVALRSREALATLRVRNGVFVLETMLWPDEVREPEFPFLDEDVEVRPQELTMAASLIDTLAGDVRPGAVHRLLPRGARVADRGQGRGSGGGRPDELPRRPRHRRRPDGGAAGQRRGRRAGRTGAELLRPTGHGTSTAQAGAASAPAKKARPRRPRPSTAAKKAAGQEGRCKHGRSRPKAPAKKADRQSA